MLYGTVPLIWDGWLPYVTHSLKKYLIRKNSINYELHIGGYLTNTTKVTRYVSQSSFYYLGLVYF